VIIFPDVVVPVEERMCSTQLAKVPGVTRNVYSEEMAKRRRRRRKCL